MSAFSANSFSADGYSKSRPTYPADFYDKINVYHSGSWGTLVDLGCGPGEASLPLVSEFSKVIATDVSATMIKTAQTEFGKKVELLKKDGKQYPEVVCKVSPSEDLSGVVVKDHTVDMVTAAECVHWFDWGAWLDEMSRVIKPGGSLIYFAYCDPCFVDYPDLQDLYNELVYEKGDFIGPYWQQPGRNYLRAMYRPLNEKVATDDRFTDVVTEYYSPLNDRHSSGSENKMVIEYDWTVQQFVDYVNTWSSSHSWNESHPGRDAGEEYYEKLRAKKGWTKETVVTLSWDTVYTFARKK